MTVVAKRVDVIAAKEDNRAAKRRYKTNALLFLVLVLEAFWLAWVHFQPYIAGVVLGGLAAGVTALWNLTVAFFESNLSESGKEFRTRLFAQTDTSFLWIAIFVVTVFGLSTSSMYLRLGTTETARVVVELTISGTPQHVKSLQVTSQNPVDVDFFYHFWPRAVHLRVVEPAGYDERRDTFYAFRKLDFVFPQDFERHQFHFLRIVPGRNLVSMLPKSGEASERHRMTIRSLRDAAEYVFHDFRYQTLYAGASTMEINRLLPSMHNDQFRDELQSYLALKGLPDTSAAGYIEEWMTEPAVLATREFRNGERLLITLEGPGSRPIEQIIRISANEVQTVILEAPP